MITFYCSVSFGQNTLPSTGNVGIGTTTPTNQLEVVGKTKLGRVAIMDSLTINKNVFRVMGDGVVWATEYNAALSVDFPDYVFEKNYNLMPLDSLGLFIEREKHLPNVPTAKEIKKDGLKLVEMQILQMKKIEELTLYILEQQKMILELKKDLELLKK